MYVLQYNVYRGQNIFCASCCSTFDFRARIEKISPCVLFFRALLPHSPHQEHKAHPLPLFFPPFYLFHSSSRMICSLTIDEMLLLSKFCADYWRCGLDGASGAPSPSSSSFSCVPPHTAQRVFLQKSHPDLCKDLCEKGSIFVQGI